MSSTHSAIIQRYYGRILCFFKTHSNRTAYYCHKHDYPKFICPLCTTKSKFHSYIYTCSKCNTKYCLAHYIIHFSLYKNYSRSRLFSCDQTYIFTEDFNSMPYKSLKLHALHLSPVKLKFYFSRMQSPNKMSDIIINSYFSSPKFTSFDISHCILHLVLGFAQVLPKNRVITELCLDLCSINDDALTKLANALKINKSITKISFSFTQCQKDGINALLSSFETHCNLNKLSKMLILRYKQSYTPWKQ
jgi:ribosomal protein L37AE/L43A